MENGLFVRISIKFGENLLGIGDHPIHQSAPNNRSQKSWFYVNKHCNIFLLNYIILLKDINCKEAGSAWGHFAIRCS